PPGVADGQRGTGMTGTAPMVFIVDDDPSIRRSLERLVRAGGYRVQTFVSARQYLERAGTEKPDCLVVDVRMPGQSGLDLQKVLGTHGHDLPFLFITGHAAGVMKMKGMSCPAAPSTFCRSRPLCPGIRTSTT